MDELENKVENQIMVSIRCLAYNHEPYIRQCLEGFVMQQTNFRFEAIVHDDASTDGTAAIIREYAEKYPDIIKPIFETENQYSKHDGSLRRIMDAAMRGKYIAMCEGDDYWTDSHKLQKQVDFMEGHKECGLCYTDYSRYDVRTKQMQKACFSSGVHRSADFEDHLLTKGYIAPMTWLYRSNLSNEIRNEKGFIDGTFAMALECYQKSKVGFIPDDTAIHVVHEGSASHQIDTRKQFEYKYDVFVEQVYYAEKYHLNDLVKQIKFDNYLQLLPTALLIQNEDFLREAYSFFRTFNIDLNQYIQYAASINRIEDSRHIRDSHAYKIGHMILKPYHYLKKVLQSKHN